MTTISHSALLSAASLVFLQNLHLYSTSITFRNFLPCSKFFCIFPSRALRSLPLSVMMSGLLDWNGGSLGNRGTNGYFWASTLFSYTRSRNLGFGSTDVYSKSNADKPHSFTLRCVAQIFAPFLPELSAAFLFRLCCRAISTGTVVISSIEVRTAASGHLRLPPTQIHGTCTSTPLTLTLRIAAISQAA